MGNGEAVQTRSNRVLFVGCNVVSRWSRLTRGQNATLREIISSLKGTFGIAPLVTAKSCFLQTGEHIIHRLYFAVYPLD